MNREIELMINRRKVKIPAKNIRYAVVTDKLCKIYLDTDEHLSLFVTISELMDKLGEEYFLRVSRSCLVAYSAIRAIGKDELVLDGDIKIPYSRARRNELASMVRNHMRAQPVWQEGMPKIEHMDFEEKFGFWNDVPIAFGVMDFLLDEDGRLADFKFCYANDALSAILEIPKEDLLSHTFGNLFNNSQRRWLAAFSKVAFQGEVLELLGYSFEVGKDLLLVGYQPAYGYAACILCDGSNKYYMQIHKILG